jgi:hypothetical protein
MARASPEQFSGCFPRAPFEGLSPGQGGLKQTLFFPELSGAFNAGLRKWVAG